MKPDRAAEVAIAMDLLEYSPETGVLRWRVHRNSSTRAGDIAGSTNSGHGYVAISFQGRLEYAHRLAWALMTGAWPQGCIDHINRDRRDNRWSNLRQVTHAENMQNSSQKPQGRNAIRGVTQRSDTGKWYAHIRVGGTARRMGPFDEIELAALVRDEARRKFHPITNAPETYLAEAARIENGGMSAPITGHENARWQAGVNGAKQR